MTTLMTTDPSTGEATETGIRASSAAEVTRIAHLAETAGRGLRDRDRAWRAGLLRAIAREIESDRELLVATAASETGLAEARLQGELTRCTMQFELFAAAVEEGGYLEATIDHRADTPLGPAPDIRRYLRAIGPVAVFGASNFPFAFSVLGGDTASALAAGCPVVVKAHGSHPLTSQRSFVALDRAAASAGALEGTVGIVYGQSAGAQLVAEPAIRAVSFTGSLETGKILARIIGERPQPIPFYGELSSVNPVVLTEAALAERGGEIAAGAAASVLGSGGQLCTKPGVIFVPAGAAGDRFAERFSMAIADADPHVALNSRVLELFEAAWHRMSEQSGVSVIATTDADPREGFRFRAVALQIHAASLTPTMVEEAFGPLALLVRYDSATQLTQALASVPPSLTATVHLGADEHSGYEGLVRFLEERAGRVVFNGFPTGVRVSWGQHHGGPWPSTTSIHSSVGVSSMRRFLAPVAYQDAPPELLPAELRDDVTDVPRRVDGVLQLATATEEIA